jgi:hypothetical protein
MGHSRFISQLDILPFSTEQGKLIPYPASMAIIAAKGIQLQTIQVKWGRGTWRDSRP